MRRTSPSMPRARSRSHDTQLLGPKASCGCDSCRLPGPELLSDLAGRLRGGGGGGYRLQGWQFTLLLACARSESQGNPV